MLNELLNRDALIFGLPLGLDVFDMVMVSEVLDIFGVVVGFVGLSFGC